MRVTGCLTVFLLCSGTSVVAHENERFSSEPTTKCLESVQTQNPEECIGLAADACARPGYSTFEMVHCAVDETKWWEQIMEQTLSELRPLEQSLDADRSDQSPLGSRREALEATQTAWEDYRNERCRYEYTHAGRGTLAGPIASQCQLRLTAEHALFLQQRLEALSR